MESRRDRPTEKDTDRDGKTEKESDEEKEKRRIKTQLLGFAGRYLVEIFCF